MGGLENGPKMKRQMVGRLEPAGNVHYRQSQSFRKRDR
jgi:hypothetical protein